MFPWIVGSLLSTPLESDAEVVHVVAMNLDLDQGSRDIFDLCGSS